METSTETTHEEVRPASLELLDEELKLVGIKYTALQLIGKKYSFVAQENKVIGPVVMVGTIVAVELHEESRDIRVMPSNNSGYRDIFPVEYFTIWDDVCEAYLHNSDRDPGEPGAYSVSGQFTVHDD